MVPCRAGLEPGITKILRAAFQLCLQIGRDEGRAYPRQLRKWDNGRSTASPNFELGRVRLQCSRFLWLPLNLSWIVSQCTMERSEFHTRRMERVRHKLRIATSSFQMRPSEGGRGRGFAVRCASVSPTRQTIGLASGFRPARGLGKKKKILKPKPRESPRGGNACSFFSPRMMFYAYVCIYTYIHTHIYLLIDLFQS